jgi:hypothetical protein
VAEELLTTDNLRLAIVGQVVDGEKLEKLLKI